ncbi:MAG: PAS domain-containing protein [Lysobacterales bacterium]
MTASKAGDKRADGDKSAARGGSGKPWPNRAFLDDRYSDLSSEIAPVLAATNWGWTTADAADKRRDVRLVLGRDDADLPALAASDDRGPTLLLLPVELTQLPPQIPVHWARLPWPSTAVLLESGLRHARELAEAILPIREPVGAFDAQPFAEELVHARRMLEIALDIADLNPWSVNLVTGENQPGPRDVELFGRRITSRAEFDEAVWPEDRAIAAQLQSTEFLHSSETLSLEFRIRHLDGRVLWLRCHARCLPDRNGRPLHLIGVSRNVSRERAAREALERSLSHLERVQQATHVVLWEWSRERGARWLMAGGIEADGMDLPRIHPDDRFRVLRQLHLSQAGNRPLECEFRLIGGSGQEQWISVQGRQLPGPAGEVRPMSGVMLDISARRRSEEQLRFTRERLRRALVAANMSTWECLPTAVDAAAGSSAEFTPEGLSAKVHPDDRELHLAAAADALSSESGDFRCQFRVVLDDGSVRWLRSLGGLIHDRHGRRQLLAGITMDVTREKAMQDALAQSREWQRLAAAAGGLNLWRVDLATGERQGGDRDQQIFGCLPSSLDSVEAMIHPEDQARVEHAWQESIRSETPYNTEYRIRAVDGGFHWLRVSGKVLKDEALGTRHMVGATLDITQQILSEQKLREALEMAERASAAKSTFLASVSHELRTPLNAVIGYSSLLQNLEHDGTRGAHVRAIHQGANQLLVLINDVLDFSRIEAGELRLEQVPFRLDECLESALEMVAAQAEAKGICLLMTASACGTRELLGDPTRWRQIALNLLSNACKFTDKGVARMDLDMKIVEQAAEVRVRVEDTGIGMTPSVMRQLFQPFRQGDDSTTRRFGGTGLGLSICKRLIDLMGGRILVKSAPAAGSVFEIRACLPLAPATETTEDAIDLKGQNVAVSVRSSHLRDALNRQLQRYEAAVELVEPSRLNEFLGSQGQTCAALITGSALLGTMQPERWPQTADGRPTPVVALVAVEESREPYENAAGARIVPVSRALGPTRLRKALRGLLAVPKPLQPSLATGITRHSGASPGSPPVLVVEDNELNQWLTILQLEALGLRATLVENGSLAVEKFQSESFPVVLMDIEMPQMDGMEAARRIRALTRPGHIRPYIIALTAHVMGESRERFLAAGMDDFVSKPVVLSELKQALDRASAAGMGARNP